jgi:hypothetical protein
MASSIPSLGKGAAVQKGKNHEGFFLDLPSPLE